MKSPEEPTWIACLTPPGQAALSTLGLHGPRAGRRCEPSFVFAPAVNCPRKPHSDASGWADSVTRSPMRWSSP